MHSVRSPCVHDLPINLYVTCVKFFNSWEIIYNSWSLHVIWRLIGIMIVSNHIIIYCEIRYSWPETTHLRSWYLSIFHTLSRTHERISWQVLGDPGLSELTTNLHMTRNQVLWILPPKLKNLNTYHIKI